MRNANSLIFTARTYELRSAIQSTELELENFDSEVLYCNGQEVLHLCHASCDRVTTDTHHLFDDGANKEWTELSFA